MSLRLRLIRFIARWLARRGRAWALVRPDGGKYLVRHVAAGTTPEPDSEDLRSAWLHNITDADADEHEHDHPFVGLAIVLHGAYTERRGDTTRRLSAGSVNFIRLGEFHRIESVEPDTWTLFLASKTDGRTWGFKILGEWIQWRKAKDAGLIATSDWVLVGERGNATTPETLVSLRRVRATSKRHRRRIWWRFFRRYYVFRPLCWVFGHRWYNASDWGVVARGCERCSLRQMIQRYSQVTKEFEPRASELPSDMRPWASAQRTEPTE